MSAFDEIEKKPRGKRTAIEQCIHEAWVLEDAERDGEKELMEQAAADLAAVREALEEIESLCLTKNREKARSLEFVPILNQVARAMKVLE